MNPILVAVLVYAVCLWAGVPWFVALVWAIGAGSLESLGSATRWGQEINRRKLKELTKR